MLRRAVGFALPLRGCEAVGFALGGCRVVGKAQPLAGSRSPTRYKSRKKMKFFSFWRIEKYVVGPFQSFELFESALFIGE
jgi:hypothetical protein